MNGVYQLIVLYGFEVFPIKSPDLVYQEDSAFINPILKHTKCLDTYSTTIEASLFLLHF